MRGTVDPTSPAWRQHARGTRAQRSTGSCMSGARGANGDTWQMTCRLSVRYTTISRAGIVMERDERSTISFMPKVASRPGREAGPSTGVIDSQSVSAAERGACIDPPW